MHRSHSTTCLVMAVILVCSASAAAQSGSEAGGAGPGWTFVPSLTAAGVIDSNVLIQSTVGDSLSDEVLTLNPSGALDFTGKRTTFSAGYAGGFTGYQSFGSLNTFEQSGSASLKRLLTPHTRISFGGKATIAPTTQSQALVGVPFVRLGSQYANVSASIDSELSRRTAVTASYTADVVRFDEDPTPLGLPLIGGHSQTGSIGVRRRFSSRFSGTADYEITWASVTSTGGGFSIQNAGGGIDYRVSDRSHFFATVGFTRLVTLDLSEPSLLPIWRAGVGREYERANFEITYGRDFVPSYGGGGTQQNQELTGRLNIVLGRRTYTQATVAWRRDTVVAERELPLTSLWLNGAFGYRLQRWAQLEFFYAGLGQHIDRPGGELDQHRIGVQVSISSPMRMK